jgi:hypothetical protein
MALFASMIGCVALGIIPAPPAPAATSGSPIQHVVVVYMENHSFNDVLGKLCVLDDRCLGTTTGLLSDGSSIPLSTAQDRIPEIGHGTGQTKIAMNHGAMNGFEHVKGCSADGGYACYVQYDPSQIPNLAALARAFAISDETFNSSAYSSWVSHIALVAATKDGFQGNIPKVSAYHPRGVGWGCDSYMDAAWRPTEHGSFTVHTGRLLFRGSRRSWTVSTARGCRGRSTEERARRIRGSARVTAGASARHSRSASTPTRSTTSCPPRTR